MHKGPGYTGFKDVHVRTLISDRLSVPLTGILEQLDGRNIKLSPLRIVNNPGQVKNGFSFVCKGVQYYGLKDAGNNVTTLCITGAESDELLDKSIQKIAGLLRKEDILLVHWSHTAIFDEKNIQQLVADFESR